MKKAFCLLLIVALALLFGNHQLLAYDVKVHKRITEETIKQNADRVNEYLKNLGLNDGADEFILGKKIIDLIKDGSYDEDYNWNLLNNPLYSHFYNPLTNKSGVGDIWFSAYDWANASINPWSWKTARNKLYEGLRIVVIIFLIL